RHDTAPPDPGGDGPLPPRSAGPPRRAGEGGVVSGDLARAHARRRRLVVPTPAGGGCRRAPLSQLPRALPAEDAARRDRPRPRRPPSPGVVQPLDAHVFPMGGAARDRRGGPRDRGLGANGAGAVGPTRGPGREDSERAQPPPAPVHPPRPAPP